MNVETHETIGEIVTKDLRKARVFRKYGIDFCCGGKRTLEQVCREKQISRADIENDLLNVGGEPRTTEANADTWEADFLADYIVNIHHAYVRKAMPDLRAWANKVAHVHGDRHPETIRVNQLFTEIADELSQHMMKEENILFPYIHELVQAKRNGGTNGSLQPGKVKSPVAEMEQEHERVGELFMEIEKLTDNFTPPADACNTYRALYINLKEFENDLFLHVHLENNILFPKAEQLDLELAGM